MIRLTRGLSFSSGRIDAFHPGSYFAARVKSGSYRSGGVGIEIADLGVRGSEQSEESGNYQIHRH